MRLQITHTTTYRYSLPARASINELRLSPEETARQTPCETTFKIEPPAKLTPLRDLFGNLVHHFEITEKHPALLITATTEVETRTSSLPPKNLLHGPLSELPELQDDRLRDFLTESDCIPKDPETWREALDLQASSENTWSSLLLTLSSHIFTSCAYEEKHCHLMRPAPEVRRERSGVCQDFSHLLIAYLRALEIPARYCSGYLYDPGLDGEDNPQLIGSGMTHAWVDAYLPGHGWVGIDPTNNCWVNEHYVSLAFGRDYHDVVPIRGSFLGGGPHRELDVSLTVKAVQ